MSNDTGRLQSDNAGPASAHHSARAHSVDVYRYAPHIWGIMHECTGCRLVRTTRLPDAEWDAEAEVPSSSVTSRCSSFCMQSQATCTSRCACRPHTQMFTSSEKIPQHMCPQMCCHVATWL